MRQKYHHSCTGLQDAARTLPAAKGLGIFARMSKDPAFFVHATAVIDDGAIIGKGCKIWHFSHLMPGCELGEDCNIGQNVVISPGVRLGRNVKVQNNVSIYTGVSCDDDVFLGPSCVFTNVINPRSAFPRKESFLSTPVGRGASIGANATIICGNRIGEYALVGAGSVVTRDVAPYSVVMGNPATPRGWVSRAGMPLNFTEEGRAVCSETGEEYLLSDGSVILLSK